VLLTLDVGSAPGYPMVRLQATRERRERPFWPPYGRQMTASERIVVIVAFVTIVVVVGAVPAYVVGLRRQVRSPGVAFIPYVGATIVFLRSMDTTGWAALFVVVPLVNLVFVIWLFFAMPDRHGRTRLWGFPLLLLPLVGLYIYAFTLSRDVRPRDTGLAGYHVPAGFA
jgi:hypothetical protein